MSELPSTARAVVIGAGIVGNSLVHHLSELGWRDLVLLDKGPFPNPGGSTGHASNFIFPVDHSKEMTALTLESMRQYKELGVFTESGGIEVARTEERMQELHRRMSSGHAWGVDNIAMVTPARDQGDGAVHRRVDPGRRLLVARRRRRRLAARRHDHARARRRRRAPSASANTELLGIDVERGRVRRVRTTRGDIETEIVVIACGVWSPAIARMAGSSIPLTPAVHQMIDIGPVPRFASSTRHIEFPIVRDMDALMYERQDGIGLEIGSYAHRPILHDPEEIPSIEAAALSPTEMPFTAGRLRPADGARARVDAGDRRRRVGRREVRDQRPALADARRNAAAGRDPRGARPLVGAAVWVKEGPGIAKSVAEWMVHGESEIDLHSSDIARFWEHQKTREHVRARTSEGFNKTYGIVHPGEQWASNRDLRLPPFHDREKELGAVFFEAAGWERPQWYESNAPLLEEYADRINPREAEWDARWWSPIINAEHLAMRDRAGDGRSQRLRRVRHPGAGRAGRRPARVGAADGRGRRPRRLHAAAHPGGGFRSDLTIMRLDDETFRVVTGGAHGAADRKWFIDNLPERRHGAV